MLRFDRLQTPPGDFDTLIEPPLHCWPELVAQNARLLAKCQLVLAGVPFATVREAVRRRLGARADTLVIACGHQPAFVHPGVWAKHVVVRRAAVEAGARGIDLVVDQDAPRTAGLVVPAISDEGYVIRREISFTTAPAGSAYEGRPVLDAAALAEIGEQLTATLGDRLASSLMPRYLEGLLAHAQAGDAVAQHVAARSGIDAELGADLAEYRVSDLFGGPVVADLLLEAERFAAAYNAALAEYRRQQRVREADRPLPDLGRDADLVETAMWVYQPRQRRRRLWVARRGDRLELYADHERIIVLAVEEVARDVDSALGPARPWLVRPRALVLTMWARLLACDLFVHGIGGAKYDRITDDIISRYYGLKPPAYTCVSATLRLPLPRFRSSPTDVSSTRHRVRDWRYNPQRYLADAPEPLLAERARLIRQSDGLRQTRGESATRRQVYLGIRQLNAQLAESDPAAGQRLVDQLKRIQREQASNQAADWREYFYLLHSRERLMGLAERLAAGASE